MAEGDEPPSSRVLREVLEEWGVPTRLTEGMSTRWRCKVAPLASTESQVFEYVLKGVPVLLADPKYASAPFQVIQGDEGKGCALEYYCDSSFDFCRPKIAFLGGWGAPGRDLCDEEYLSLVGSFKDVVDPLNQNPKNLQMFHREEEEQGYGEEGKGKIPVLPRELEWPLPMMLGSSRGEEAEPDASDVGVVCDNATRLSQRGAVTWWHLDDGGEFVLQVGLPLKEDKQKDARYWDKSGKPIVKIFIFAEKSHYKLITQDLEGNKTGRAACLDLFTTPSEYLPDDAMLPVFWVAPLLAGGYPLLSPPNAPHMVVTAQDCVMIEQRRISKVFLDEVEYFLRRARIWNKDPILYDFIEKDLQDGEKILRHVAEPLMTQAEECLSQVDALSDGGTAGEGEDSGLKMAKQKLVRIESSLSALLLEEFFPQREEVCTRIRKLQEDLKRRGIVAVELDPREALRKSLVDGMSEEEEKILSDGGKAFYAMVHERGQPRWGPRRDTREEALKDRKKLKRACLERRLHECMMNMKQGGE
ncbi:hypothetical protein HOP50_07g47490 [Chloropicon primus]|uniref:Uncharacterized protein n=1 Tax=Chloropicon primus TaxID=1764295 RepID=A0A5B8MNZ3_9CHLO|nr:hypothetical protein A3770_07p47270 [Chloropicon primus]UPR01427.1 hypothetical protein HOP50_07g47490 [Chloropicon primus]|eukprot:QDZ22209.1 hypothetical protein A3770_07p47270 [Chloropicon primus]